MATSPIVSNASHSLDIAYGPDNPQTETIEQQQQTQDIPSEYKDKMVQTITTYRGEWAPDRLMRIPQWMKNVLMYRGQQVLAYDPGSNTYFDALAWWRQSGAPQDGADSYLEKYINNITQMLGDSFIGTMSRGIPPTIVQPENAEILADVTTAKAAQEAISIIERMNRIHELVRIENSLLYLYGVYFKYTRAVQDGEWAGWDEEDEFGDIQVTKPDRYHCFNCGQDTPAASFSSDTAKTCTGCDSSLGPEAFYPSESTTEISFTGQKKVAKAMVRWDVYGPLEIDADPKAKRLEHTPLLSLDLDVDVGPLRMTFPAMAEKIKQGAEVGTTPNASYEKLRRGEVYSQNGTFTTDSQQITATYSRNWLQPISYWKLGDQEFAEWMMERYPMGCKVSLVGTEIVDVRPASLTKEWSCCVLRENVGLYPPSIADNVVPFNERLNDAMNIIDDWIERCSAGMTVYDKTRIDAREVTGKVFGPGVLNGLATRGNGATQALADSLYQFKFSLDPEIFTYPNMLIQMAETISGVTPQTFGAGTTPGVETAKGQAQQLDTSLTKLNIYWENEKDEHAAASQNAIECLQTLMQAGAVGEIWEVIQANGSEFRNNYINLNKMRGRIKVYPDTDEGLPQSPMQIRQSITNLLEEAGKGNKIAQAVVDVIPNQERFMSVVAPPGTVTPGAAQRSKTQQDINTLMEQDWIVTADPQTGQPIQQLPVVPEWYEDFPILRDTIRLFCQENCDYRKANPAGWARLKAFNDLAEQMDTQIGSAEAQRTLQVKQAGSPPPPQPNPQEQQALQVILQDAAGEVGKLANMSALPPAATKGSITGQVSAAGKIVDAAQKAQEAISK